MSAGNGSASSKNATKTGITPPQLASHKFQVGNQAAVGHGRPPTSKLWDAIQKVEKSERLPFLEHVAKQAYKDNRLIPPILDRIEPKLVSDDDRAPASVVINLIHFTVEVPHGA